MACGSRDFLYEDNSDAINTVETDMLQNDKELDLKRKRKKSSVYYKFCDKVCLSCDGLKTHVTKKIPCFKAQ